MWLAAYYIMLQLLSLSIDSNLVNEFDTHNDITIAAKKKAQKFVAEVFCTQMMRFFELVTGWVELKVDVESEVAA